MYIVGFLYAAPHMYVSWNCYFFDYRECVNLKRNSMEQVLAPTIYIFVPSLAEKNQKQLLLYQREISYFKCFGKLPFQ